ncbi:hypothetical protein PG984_007914 [Apiospora sp. TS-2023a]
MEESTNKIKSGWAATTTSGVHAGQGLGLRERNPLGSEPGWQEKVAGHRIYYQPPSDGSSGAPPPQRPRISEDASVRPPLPVIPASDVAQRGRHIIDRKDLTNEHFVAFPLPNTDPYPWSI